MRPERRQMLRHLRRMPRLYRRLFAQPDVICGMLPRAAPAEPVPDIEEPPDG